MADELIALADELEKAHPESFRALDIAFKLRLKAAYIMLEALK